MLSNVRTGWFSISIPRARPLRTSSRSRARADIDEAPTRLYQDLRGLGPAYPPPSGRAVHPRAVEKFCPTAGDPRNGVRPGYFDDRSAHRGAGRRSLHRFRPERLRRYHRGALCRPAVTGSDGLLSTRLEEVNGRLHPSRFTIKTVPARFQKMKDPMAPIFARESIWRRLSSRSKKCSRPRECSVGIERTENDRALQRNLTSPSPTI